MGIPWGALATGAASGYADFAQGQQQGQDRALQLALTMANAKKQQEQADLQRRIGEVGILNTKSEIATRELGKWEKEEPSVYTDPTTGEERPIQTERNSKTGERRPVQLDLGALAPGGRADHTQIDPTAAAALAPPVADEPMIGPPTEDQQSVAQSPANKPPQAPTSPLARALLRPYAKPAAVPLADKMQKDIAALVATGVPLAAASARVRLQYGQQDQQPPQQSFTFPTITSADGKQIVARANTKTGAIEPTDFTAKAGGAAGGANQAVQKARMLAAVSEARLADERMRAYEDKLLNGTSSVSPLKQAAGSLTTNLADSHTPFGALMQAGSEFGLNRGDPEYAQYLRDASTIGRAEQMISPRGGNETMVRANALLSRAGTGAQRETIDASRMARQALFGEAGGLAQSMTPEQNASVKAGLKKIQTGTTGKADATGDIDLRTPPAKPDLATRVQQLKAAGISKAAAVVQLQHEGYDLSAKPPGGDE